MKLNIRRAAGLLAAAALLGTVPVAAGTAQAQTTHRASSANPYIGKLQVVLVGMPHSVKRGTSFNVRIWYRENSPLPVQPIIYSVLMEKTHTSHNGNVWVSWLDPKAGHWRPSTFVPPLSGFHDYVLQSNQVVQANRWAHMDVSVYVGKHAELGSWFFEATLQNYMLIGRPGAVLDPTSGLVNHMINVVR